MDYEFLNSSIEIDNIILPNSDKINPFLLKNNYAEIVKGIDFIASENKFLYVHGFMGTGKRQFINYVCDFINNDVIKLEYYCKESTVCDDILLAFTDIIDNNSISKAVNINTKITTLSLKFQQQISSIKKPFLFVLHSFDDVQEENIGLIKELLLKVLKEDNVKVIISTRGLNPNLLGDTVEEKKIFLKAFTKDIFKKYLESTQIKVTDTTCEDFYKYTRGYYYYLALSIKIIQAMKVDLNTFLSKFNQSGMSFDSFLGHTYINLVPTSVRNFFWFLRTMRHGVSLNALADFEVYDEFSIEYLKTNLMVFQADEMLYVQDYFLQKIDISIPEKTQIKLHKYIIGIYEKQLKLSLKDRALLMSRQALRAEIEYHNDCIYKIENTEEQIENLANEKVVEARQELMDSNDDNSVISQLAKASNLIAEKKYTEAIELCKKIADIENIDLQSLVEARLNLARLYKKIDELHNASHYYELVELYYLQNNELINLNYLYYEMTELYFSMYKHSRAIETAKKVVYSVDTPQSLLVSACTLLGNIYSDMNNAEEAFLYYKKALESLDENVSDEVLAELYFKYALASDDKGDMPKAFEFYNKCILIGRNNVYKSMAYSNLASCYQDNGSYDDAKTCYEKAYKLEKENNNYEGIYYIASNLACLIKDSASEKVLEYLLEAKKSAEFINEEYYILESTLALGDYYYNNKETHSEALREYFIAEEIASRISTQEEVSKINKRIEDMKLRMTPEDFATIEKKYAK